jgi:curved DNA-binding protein CbpA
MDIKDACHLLDIEIDNLVKITKVDLKKKFHKSALKYHPDKNGNTLDATIKFQQINEAYRYLLSNLDFEDKGSNDNYDDNIFSCNMQYMNLLNVFIESIIKGSYKETLFKILQEIMKGYKEISNKLFEDLDRDTSLEIYHFLCKYKSLLYINTSIIENIRNIIIEKFSKDNIIILNPNLIQNPGY